MRQPGSASCRAAAAPVRVLLVDDHQLFRRGLALVLEREPDIEVVGEAGDGAQALNRVLALHPDVVLMDVRMPGSTGIEACSAIKDAAPAVQIVIVTMSDTDADLLDAVRAGACGYVFKEASGELVAGAVRAAVLGRSMVGPSMAMRLLAEFNDVLDEAGRLTEREESVMADLAAGHTAAEIATELGTGTASVEGAVRAVLGKVAGNARARAVAAGEQGRRAGVRSAARVTPAARSVSATHSAPSVAG